MELNDYRWTVSIQIEIFQYDVYVFVVTKGKLNGTVNDFDLERMN